MVPLTVPLVLTRRVPPLTTSPSAWAPDPTTSSKPPPAMVLPLSVPLLVMIALPPTSTRADVSRPPDETFTVAESRLPLISSNMPEPPARMFCVPPPPIVLPLATPPDSVSVPPPLTWVKLSVPLAKMIARPPDSIRLPLASPPLVTDWTPPLTMVPLASPPRPTTWRPEPPPPMPSVVSTAVPPNRSWVPPLPTDVVLAVPPFDTNWTALPRTEDVADFAAIDMLLGPNAGHIREGGRAAGQDRLRAVDADEAADILAARFDRLGAAGENRRRADDAEVVEQRRR